jgi:hypothetical protein
MKRKKVSLWENGAKRPRRDLLASKYNKDILMNYARKNSL